MKHREQAPALLTALLLFAAPPLAGTPGLSRKVLILGIDGLRPDAIAAANTPNLDALIADGSYSPEAQVGPNTVSGPGWSSMLTGVWSDKHGVTDNGFAGQNYTQYPNLLARVETELPALRTSAQLSWLPLFTELVLGADHTFYQDYASGGDVACTADAVDQLANFDPDVMFTYFADVDVAGHTWGFSPSVPQYITEIEQVDAQIGQILTAMRARPTFAQEDWLVLVSTDHGGIGTGHSGGQPLQRTIFVIASGPSAKKGTLIPIPSVVDVASTALAHVGIPIDPAWQLDGVPLGLNASTALGSNLIANGDAETSTGNGDFAPDRGLSAWRDIGPLTAIRYDAGLGFPDASDPGPPSRGASFLSGGAGTQNDLITQLQDITDIAHWVDLGVVEFELAGWLGGYAEQEDRMSLSATFLDASGSALGQATIGPVTLADRQAAIGGTGEALTGLLERSASGGVPTGTRRIQLELLAEHFAGGGTDGYGDNLSLILTLSPAFDCNGNGTSDALDIFLGNSPDVDGNGVPDECDGTSMTYCSTAPNSAGPGAAIGYSGTILVSANDFVLEASLAAPSQPGVFFYGPTESHALFGEGFLCIGGQITRLPVVAANAQGSASYALDFQSLSGAGVIAAGTTKSFQYWYRDPAGGGAGFNLTHGLSVAFCP